MKVTQVEAPPCLVGEGPLWDDAAQALYFLDIVGRRVHRLDPATGATRSWTTPTNVGAMALRQRGGAVLALNHDLQALDFETGALQPLARLEVSERTTINDGRVDRAGRFLLGLCTAGVENPQPIGGLYSLGVDHKVSQLDSGVHFSNSPCFSPDGRTLYFADSHLYTLYAYDYDPATGAVARRRPFLDTRPLGGMPDGATVDADGRIWLTLMGAGQVAVVRPDGGLERLVEIPVRLVSSVAFGGPGLDRLYVTSVDPGFFGQTPEPGGGGLFVVEGLDARGLPEARYAG